MASLLNMSGGSLLGKGLPYDAEIEYLESSGTQWIDPYVESSYMGGMAGKFQLQRYPSSAVAIIGNGGSVGIQAYSVRLPRNDYIKAYTKSGSYNTGIFSDYNIHEFSLSLPTNTYTLDNTSTSVYSTRGGGTYKLYLFAYSMLGIVDFSFSFIGRIYWFKFYDNGTLIRDFIPVRVGQVGYMYDKVSKQLFGNSGTGDFILGPDVTN